LVTKARNIVTCTIGAKLIRKVSLFRVSNLPTQALTSLHDCCDVAVATSLTACYAPSAHAACVNKIEAKRRVGFISRITLKSVAYVLVTRD